MARNKVVINGETYIDLTDTTATADKILQGYGAYGADGEWIDGSVRGRTFAITNNSTAGSIMVHYTLANNITSSSGQINNSTGSVAVGATKTYTIPFMTVYIEFSKGAAATNTNFKLLVDGVEKAPEVEWGHKKLYSFSSTNISPSGTTILEFRDSEDPWPVDIVTEPLSVTSNGTYTAPSGTAYTPVTVNVPTPTPSLQTKSVSPSETAQTVTPDSGYDGLSQVSVGAISNTYVGSGIMRRSLSDLTASGAAVNVPAGYYASAASKAVASGTEGTPTATKGMVSNHSVTVTPSVTNTAGYISGGTKTGTGVTVTASELVSGSETKNANGTYDVTNLASLVVSVPIVTYYTGSGAPSSSLGSNGDIYLQTS